MIQRVFTSQDIPLADLERIGLVQNGRFLIEDMDLDALMAGRRTRMLHLRNLIAEGTKIGAINAKLSLRPDKDGKAELLLHPVYKEAVCPEYLTEAEAEKLQNGTAVTVEKVIVDQQGRKLDVLIEYDPDTREFIITDTNKIITPDMVNNEPLTPEQKRRFRKGREVELSDGAVFQYTANDVQGLRSNKLALVASIIVDGGISYMLYKGLNALFNKKRDDIAASKQSPGYQMAFDAMIADQKSKAFLHRAEVIEQQSRVKR